MRIVLCYPLESRHLRQLRQEHPDVQWIDAGQEHVAEALLEADAFCGHAKVPVPWEQVVAGRRLQWIQSSAAGLDHCLTPEVIASPIEVSSASGLFADQVAEQTMALLLGLLRGIPTFHQAQLRREFVRQPTRDLHGATVGILGLGANGRRIAEVLRPWRVRILATDCFVDERPECVDLLLPISEQDQVLSLADVVILCVPLNGRTTAMIDERALRLMKPGALLINVARGPVIDEAAMVRALIEGRLGGAGLDVAQVEPPPKDSVLWDAPRTLITPHVGAQSRDRLNATTDFISANLFRRKLELPIWNLVDKSLGFPTPNTRPPPDWRQSYRGPK